jgi:16S rRNA A1518/A1519 N6-dimethyltransferase RsmA/KsgA/DIM1 with predicted DNA glycosylase/AP lyase activity
MIVHAHRKEMDPSLRRVGSSAKNVQLRYPKEAIEAIFQHLPKDRKIRVVEFGAGTGIFTRILLADERVEKIIAVEPAEGMREGFWNSTGREHQDRVEVVDGSFEHAPVEDGWADLVTAAQASVLS